MEEEKLLEKAKQIAQIVAGMQWFEWRKIAAAIEQEYSQESNRVQLNDAREIEKTIRMLGFGLFSKDLDT